jgi:hypothetical protein
MTTWHSAWGWCTDIPTMVLLWGAVLTAAVLAVRSAARQPSDPPAPTATGYPRPDGAMPARIARTEIDDDFTVG